MADSVGERIKTLRLERGYTLRALAQRSGISQGTLSMIENGTRDGENLTARTIRRLAKALGTTTDYLVGMYKDETEQEEFLAAAVA